MEMEEGVDKEVEMEKKEGMKEKGIARLDTVPNQRHVLHKTRSVGTCHYRPLTSLSSTCRGPFAWTPSQGGYREL